MDYREAIAWLDDHINLEATRSPTRLVPPTLDRMRELVGLLAEPQHQYPVLHVTGTNGKTSAARFASRLLEAAGLAVGTYTSPHIETVTERLAWNGEAISEAAFAEVISEVAALTELMATPPSWFEIMTAAAFAWFADLPVSAAVVEVGLLGRWDATNVADGSVAVITNVGLDHVDYAGSLENIAREKAGIVKPGATLVLGETDPDLLPILEDVPAGAILRRGEDFEVLDRRLAHGGRLLTVRTPRAVYDQVFLSVHGAFQADNAAIALAAVEAFVGRPLGADLVEEAFAGAPSPGRLEVMGHQPLVLLDGAHNPDGARALAAAVVEEFAVPGRTIVVFGVLDPHDPAEILDALRDLPADEVVACAPRSPRAVAADDVVAAADDLGIPAEAAPTVAAAVDRALARAHDDDLVLVTGSLYTVGNARMALRARGWGAGGRRA